jgi:hypothetical protein
LKRILLPVLFVLHMAANAAVLQLALPPINLKDQHEKPLAIARDTKLVFFAAEMDGSRLMTKALAVLPPTSLKDKNAVYIADISSMPGLVSIMFALPKMQREAYTVGLIRDAKEGASLPRKPGAVTVLRIDDGKVSAVDFAQDLQQISRHLK